MGRLIFAGRRYAILSEAKHQNYLEERKRQRWEQKFCGIELLLTRIDVALNVGSSCARLPIKFASLIHGLIERAASECAAKSILASNVYECLGRQALAAGEP
jgi:hypothetical protein